MINLKSYYVVINIETGKYFDCYRGENYWDSNISEAMKFQSIEEVRRLDEYDGEYLEGLQLEIKQIFEVE